MQVQRYNFFLEPQSKIDDFFMKLKRSFPEMGKQLNGGYDGGYNGGCLANTHHVRLPINKGLSAWVVGMVGVLQKP